MEENLNEVRRPVYRNLRIIWLVFLVGFVISFWDNILVSAAGVVLLIVRLVQMRALVGVSDAMARAYRVMCIGLALTIGCLLLGLLAARAAGARLDTERYLFAGFAGRGGCPARLGLLFLFRTGRPDSSARLCLSAGPYHMVLLAVSDWLGDRRNCETAGGGMAFASVCYRDNGRQAGADLAVS